MSQDSLSEVESGGSGSLRTGSTSKSQSLAESICSSTPGSEEIPANRDVLRIDANIKLSKFEAQLFAAVIEDAVCQLMILGNCNKELKSRQPMIMNSGLVPMSKNPDRMEVLDLTQIGKEDHKYNKMVQDRETITSILVRLYLDLKINSSFATLLVQLENMTLHTRQGIENEHRNKENRETMRRLQQTLRLNSNSHKSILHQSELEICGLLDEIDDNTWNSDIKTRYISNWQRAREEQHALAMDQAESKHTDHLALLETNTAHEERVHHEIIKFIEEATERLSEKIEEWMKKFDDEQEQLDMDIRIFRDKRETQLEETADLERLFQKRQKEIDAWIEFTTERQRKIDFIEYQHQCATRIQAWWRGIITRRRLEKERKASKKKSGGKPKKGKK